VQRKRHLQLDRDLYVHHAVGRRELPILECDYLQQSWQRAAGRDVFVQRGFHGNRLFDDVPGRELLPDRRGRSCELPGGKLLRRWSERSDRVPGRPLLGSRKFGMHDMCGGHVRFVVWKRELHGVCGGNVLDRIGNVVFALPCRFVPIDDRSVVVRNVRGR
jgi:hypothetical protein